jgi:WD40 repeat protein
LTSRKLYDAFLSYNALDQPVVEALAEHLRAEGLKLYLEAWEILPGQGFQPALAGALIDSKTCVALLGPNGLGPWQIEELQNAIDRRVRDPDFRVIPVLLPGAERPRRGEVVHLEFLINASWVEFLKTIDDRREFDKLVDGIRGDRRPRRSEEEAKRWAGRRPYRGLEAFGPDDAPFFFGRQNLTDWLVSDLRRGVHLSKEVRLLAVLGPSGSGKSSVVLAGLIPSLKEGKIDGSAHWPIAVVRPGDNPLGNLAAELVARFSPAGSVPDVSQARKLIADFQADEQAVDVFARMALQKAPSESRLLVIVDQFEEVFTYRPENEEARQRFEAHRAAFFNNLLHAATAQGGRVAVVLTMRSDFLGACAPFPKLNDILIAHMIQVGPMQENELREAIEQPAYLVGYEVKPDLTERLLADVRGQAGALPLLEFALDELWKQPEHGRELTKRVYDELGGVAGALEHRADAIFQSFTPEDQELCKRLFLRLVQLGEGTEDTKRQVSFTELLPLDPTRAQAMRRVIETLSDRDARLITTEGDQPLPATGAVVEVAHEALIRGWRRLREWVDTERSGLRIQRRLTESAQEWASAPAEKKDDYLDSGARLATALEWAEVHREELSAIEAAFLSASQEGERRRKEIEKQFLLEREHAERRRAEEAEARERDARAASKRQRRLAAVAALLALIAFGLALWANQSRQEATASAKKAKENEGRALAQARVANSRQITAIAETERDKHLDRSLILAVQALNMENTLEARTSLYRTLLVRPEVTSFLHSGEGRVSSVVFSPDGKTLAVGYRSQGASRGGVVLWDVARRTRLDGQPLAVPEGGVSSVAFSPDGTILAAGHYVGGLVVWDVAKRTRLASQALTTRHYSVRSVAFSPDGRILAAGYGNVFNDLGGVVLWDVARRARLAEEPLAVPKGGVGSVAFSPDGRILAAGYAQSLGGVVLWDAARWTRLTDQSLPVDEGSPTELAFSPDGTTLAVGYRNPGGSSRGGVVLWDVAQRTRRGDRPLEVSEGAVGSVAFDPSGKTLAVSSGRGAVLWDMARQKWLTHQPMPLPEGGIYSIAFSPDGTTLAAGYDAGADTGGVVLWEPRQSRLTEPPLDVPEGNVEVAFDKRTLAAAYFGPNRGGVVLWDETRRQKLAVQPPEIKQGGVLNVALSPDGGTLAAGWFEEGRSGVMLWDLVRHAPQAGSPLAVPEAGVSGVAFSPDGTILATAYSHVGGNYGGGMVLWDVARRARLPDQPMPVPEGDISSVAFSPDGRILVGGCGISKEKDFVGGLVLWDVAHRARLTEPLLDVPEGPVTSVAFSPDGTILAAGYHRLGFGGGVLVWDVARRERLTEQPFVVPEGGVFSIALSTDGRLLAAGYSGGFVLWDMALSERLIIDPLTVPEGDVRGLAFSHDGKTLAVGYGTNGGRGGVLLYDVDLESWKRRAERVANRNLTHAEWRQYLPDMTYEPTFKDLPIPAEESNPSPAPASEPPPPG